MLAQFLKILGVRLHVLLVVKALLDNRVKHRVEHRDIAAGAEAQGRRRVPRQSVAARVHDKDLGAAFCRLLEKGCRHRMVFGRTRADHDDYVGIAGGGERCGNRARADPLHQCRDR